ncbi:hypothetical protein AMTR_s00077p00018280 [Amborella trichopoda]|uniref:Uncharacterized protein n=1 Tax=Amborella trichopoda TaxID=13333 RepID=W1P8U9_AMBTC|nr:hypothetical protein AMTR_s00077p00018280 [Amborella trichopoda]
MVGKVVVKAVGIGEVMVKAAGKSGHCRTYNPPCSLPNPIIIFEDRSCKIHGRFNSCSLGEISTVVVDVHLIVATCCYLDVLENHRVTSNFGQCDYHSHSECSFFLAVAVVLKKVEGQNCLCD